MELILSDEPIEAAPILSEREIDVAAHAYRLSGLKITFADFLAARRAATDPEDRCRVERVDLDRVDELLVRMAEEVAKLRPILLLTVEAA